MMGISSGLLLGDLLGELEAENCLNSSTVKAPNMGLSSNLLGQIVFLLDGEFPTDTELLLLLFLGVPPAEPTSHVERLVSTPISFSID